MPVLRQIAAILALVAIATPATAATPRETLVHVVFFAQDKASALAAITRIEAVTRPATDRDTRMVHAMALTYRARLAGSRTDAIAARLLLEELSASDPRDPEPLAALGGWHIGGVVALGGLIARGVLGARKAVGLDSIERAVKLGGNRAMYAALAGLLRLQLDPADPRAPALLTAAVRAGTPTVIDQQMQHHAQQMLDILKRGDHAAIRKAASRLMPLGQLNA